MAPSTAARYSSPGVLSDPGRRPVSAPEARGQLGDRSPTRYGRKRTPWHPAGTEAASAASSLCGRADMAATSATTCVQFIVHSNGRYPPVASQNGAMAPSGSCTARALYPNSVPLVPSGQGLTFVHFSRQRNHSLWERCVELRLRLRLRLSSG